MWDLRVLPFSTLPSRPPEHFTPRWSPVGAFSPLQEAAEIHYVAAADCAQVVVRPVLLARSLSRPVRGWSWASPFRRRLFLARGPGPPGFFRSWLFFRWAPPSVGWVACSVRWVRSVSVPVGLSVGAVCLGRRFAGLPCRRSLPVR